MKWKWFIITPIVMFAIVRNIEECDNLYTLIETLSERGIVAWVELFAITIAIVLPSFLITKALERLTTNFYPKLFFWKSLFFSVFSIVTIYLVIMVLLESIKHV